MRDSRSAGGAWARFQQHGFLTPAPDLAPLVRHYWWARWDLRDQPDYRQLIVPHPSVQLTFPSDAPTLVRGVSRGRIHRTLSGNGGVFGVTFRPGTFRRLLARPVASLTDRAIPAESVFGPSLVPIGSALLAYVLDSVPSAGDRVPSQDRAPSPGDRAPAAVEALEAFLRSRLPPPDPVADQVAAWVDAIAGSTDLRRADLAAERFGVGVRRLQRLFAEHVGVSPKWVIRRFRLHEVTERLASRRPGEQVDWAGLAADLGYVDQAHLTRDFTAMFGEPPTTYATRY